MTDANKTDLISLTDDELIVLASLDWWTWIEAANAITGLRHKGPFDKDIYAGGPPARVYRQIKEAIPCVVAGNFDPRVRPRQAVTWAIDTLHLEVPHGIRHLRMTAEEIASATAPTESSQAEESLGAKERRTLLTMVIAMAIKGFEYKPDGRNSAAQEISDAAAELAMSVDADTVRKWLNLAKDEVLPAPRGALGSGIMQAANAAKKR